MLLEVKQECLVSLVFPSNLMRALFASSEHLGCCFSISLLTNGRTNPIPSFTTEIEISEKFGVTKFVSIHKKNYTCKHIFIHDNGELNSG